jgi:hypothetical protein
VGAATGLHPVSLSQLERGERPLRGASLRLLARHYETAPEQLLREMARWAARERTGAAGTAAP